MVIFPCFKLEAEGNDITDYIKNNLISLTLDDRDGKDSDQLSFSVAGIFERPILGDSLNLSLGANGEYYDYGAFAVQTTSIDHKAITTGIRATAVNFAGKLKERNSQLWEKLTLADIAAQIAGRHGFEASTDGAETINIASQAQNNENDLAFLERLADKFGFICAIKDSTVILRKTGTLAEITIDKTECTALNIDRAAKSEYGAVKLIWQDLDSSDVIDVTAGSGEPVYYLRDVQPKNPQEALDMANAKLASLDKGAVMGSLSIAGGRAVRAGAKLVLTGAGGDSGEYHIEGVTHNMTTTGYTINIEFSGIKGAK